MAMLSPGAYVCGLGTTKPEEKGGGKLLRWPAQQAKNMGSLVEAVNILGSLFYGGLLGVFVEGRSRVSLA